MVSYLPYVVIVKIATPIAQQVILGSFSRINKTRKPEEITGE